MRPRVAPPSLSRRTWLRGVVLGTAVLSRPDLLWAAPEDRRFWDLLREGGCIVLMRHALTVPGVGDPPHFRLGDCSTQRNLSEAGREQSRRVGQAFIRGWRHHHRGTLQRLVPLHRNGGPGLRTAPRLGTLNSFFARDGREQQTREVLQALRDHRAPANLVLVTHQVNISALTGQSPAMGELFLTRPDGVERLPVLARLSG
jgi:hypothetical protein